MKIRRNVVLTVLLFIIVFLLSLSYISFQFKAIDALINRTNQQSIRTQELEQEVKQLKTANARLESAIVYQHNKINELNNKPSEVKYITATKSSGSNEEVHIDWLPDPTVVIVGALATLGTMVKSFVPAY